MNGRTTVLLTVVVVAGGAACSGSQAPRRLDPEVELPSRSALAAERTEIGYRTHDEVMADRRDLEEAVPPGGRITVTLRRATLQRADFSKLTVVLTEDGREVLRALGLSGNPELCHENLWCDEQVFDVPTALSGGALRVIVVDGVTGTEHGMDIEADADLF